MRASRGASRSSRLRAALAMASSSWAWAEMEAHPAGDQQVVEPRPERARLDDDREWVRRRVIRGERRDEPAGLGGANARLVRDHALLVDDGDDDAQLDGHQARRSTAGRGRLIGAS